MAARLRGWFSVWPNVLNEAETQRLDASWQAGKAALQPRLWAEAGDECECEGLGPSVAGSGAGWQQVAECASELNCAKPSVWVAYAYEAVWTAAWALSRSYNATPPSAAASPNSTQPAAAFVVDKAKLASEIPKVDFTGPTGRVAFDANGDRRGTVLPFNVANWAPDPRGDPEVLGRRLVYTFSQSAGCVRGAGGRPGSGCGCGGGGLSRGLGLEVGRWGVGGWMWCRELSVCWRVHGICREELPGT